MCHCIFFGINPRVSKHHAFCLHRVLRRILCFTVPIAGLSAGRAGPSQTPSRAIAPLLSAHALSKRRPSGRGNNGQRCGKCGKSHERGNCPAYGKTCDKCKGINHFKAVCHSKVTAKTMQSPHRSKKSQPHRHSSKGSYSGQGKGGGNCQHQKKKTPKKLLKQKAYAVT